MKGKFIGIGVGPGDPELLTLKAVKALESAKVLAVPRTKGENTLALNIVKEVVDIHDKELVYLDFFMTHDMEKRKENLYNIFSTLRQQLNEGKDVAMITLGDPSLYTTLGYVLENLQEDDYDWEIIPGVTSISAVAARLGTSLTKRHLPLHIIPGAYHGLEEYLALPGTKVIMKGGLEISDLKEKLKEADLFENTMMISDCGLETEVIVKDLNESPDRVSYFTTFVVKE